MKEFEKLRFKVHWLIRSVVFNGLEDAVSQNIYKFSNFIDRMFT